MHTAASSNIARTVRAILLFFLGRRGRKSLISQFFRAHCESSDFLPFRSFCAVFRALPSRRTLVSNEIPYLALVVSVPTICFKNERYTSIHSLCSSLQRCKKWRMKEKKKREKICSCITHSSVVTAPIGFIFPIC